MQTIHRLRDQVLKAKHAYYYGSKPTMTDAEFDALEDQLRQLSPDDAVLTLVGAPVPLDGVLTKARHSMPMGSQNKVNSLEEFEAWGTKNNVLAYHASLKGDGASAAAYYQGGRLVKVISRGDGEVGEDITANAMRFKGLPAYVGTQHGSFSGSVRFEGILTVADWAIVDPAMSKNPRNTGNGIMGRKNGLQSELITSFAFDVEEIRDGQPVPWLSETQKSERLVELGFNCIEHRTFDNAQAVAEYFNQISAGRTSLPFWIDGVVIKIDDVTRQKVLGVSGGCPKGQIAWKFDADSAGAESVLESVVVSGGHTGGLFPTAQFRPVEIGGTTVSCASLANYDEIERLGLAVGDRIWVVKANDIIPKVIRVTERPAGRTPIAPPACCPFCGGEVGRKKTSKGEAGVIIVCMNPECSMKSTGKISRWIASLDILGIGDSLLEALIDRFELEDAAGLYTLHLRQAELPELVINVERDLRLGIKRTASILAAIDLKRQLTLSEFLGSLGLQALGKRRVELMVKAAGGELATLQDWRAGKLRDPAFAARAGVPGIGAQIQAGIDNMDGLIDRLFAAGVTITEPAAAVAAQGEDTAPLRTLCISGTLPSGKKKAAYKAPLLAAGYTLVDEVAKGLNCLVLADPGSNSTKAQKAHKLGIQVISHEQMLALLSQ